MTRTLLFLALAAAVPARAANEFKPIKATETVTYPLPPIRLKPLLGATTHASVAGRFRSFRKYSNTVG